MESIEVVEPTIAALRDAVERMLSNNFDADSKTCCVTLIKMIDNMIHRPGNDRVRTVRVSNAAFDTKVGCRPGGIEFLMAAGMERRTAAAPLLSDGGGATTGEVTLVLPSEREHQGHLVAARRLLSTTYVQTLQGSPHDIPAFRQPPPPPPPPPPAAAAAVNAVDGSSAIMNDSSSAAVVPRDRSLQGSQFNVYRGHRYDGPSAAVGTCLGPGSDPNYVSPTERQLQLLQQKQKKLEQKMQQNVNREWCAHTPVSSSTAAAAAAGGGQQQQPRGGGGSNKGDSALLAQRMKRMQEEQKQREHGTLTTRAMRDLEKMKKEKVYSHCTVTVQFPDGCRLTGKFVPADKIESVIQSIQSDCFLPSDNSSSGCRDFDLYVTPPRQLLSKSSTLKQGGLVPAAKVFVSWKSAAAAAAAAPSSSSSSPSPGSYLRPELFAASTSQQQQHQTGNGGGAAAAAFPASQPVISSEAKKPPPTAAAAGTADGSSGGGNNREEDLLRRMMGGGGGMNKKKSSNSKSSSSSTGKSNTNTDGSGKKPKWFKR